MLNFNNEVKFNFEERVREDENENEKILGLILNRNFILNAKLHSSTVCHLLKNAKETALFRTHFLPRCPFIGMTLSNDGQRMHSKPNAGGSSIESEVMSLEVLKQLFQAKLMATETEVTYKLKHTPILDYTANMFGHIVAVSVTRAMRFRGEFQYADAERLLFKKLLRLNIAATNILVKSQKSLLHIWATSENVALLLSRCYENAIPGHLKLNTIILITITSETSKWLYTTSKNYSY